MSNVEWDRIIYYSTIYYYYDADHDSMTLTQQLNLNVLKMYQHTKNWTSKSRLSKVGTLETDTQTDATERTMTPHSQILINNIL